jgi:hypothetical protein
VLSVFFWRKIWNFFIPKHFSFSFFFFTRYHSIFWQRLLKMKRNRAYPPGGAYFSLIIKIGIDFLFFSIIFKLKSAEKEKGGTQKV